MVRRSLFPLVVTAAVVVRGVLGCGDDTQAAGGLGDASVEPDGAASGGGDGGGGGGGGAEDGAAPAPRWATTVELASSFAVSDAVYVAGANSIGRNVKWRVEKHALADGALVPGFGTGGVLEIPLDPNAQMSGGLRIAADEDSIYLVGNFGEFGVDRLERRNASDGSLVWSKNVLGCPNTREREHVAVEGDFVYVGCFGVLFKHEKATGEYPKSFNDGGSVTWQRPDYGGVSYSSLRGFFVKDGFAVGYGRRALGTVEEYTAYIGVRRASDGSPVWERTPPKPEIQGGASDGTSVFFVTPVGVAGTWRLEKRALSTGEVDEAFGAGGQVTGEPDEDGLDSLVATYGGKVYVATLHRSPMVGISTAVRALDATTGAPVVGFGDGGRILTPHATSDLNRAKIVGIIADETSLYTLQTDWSADAGRWHRLERRDRATGAL